MIKYAAGDIGAPLDSERIQRVVEGQNLDIRQFLYKYEHVIEGQRQEIQRRRQAILSGEMPCASDLERLVSLTTVDDLWSEYLAAIAELREGTQWVSWTGLDPLHEYLMATDRLFKELEAKIAEETPKRVTEAQAPGIDPSQRGATWTYLTTDQPFGNFTERFLRGLKRKLKKRRFWE
jgi:preprotein translocase subunit SecA